MSKRKMSVRGLQRTPSPYRQVKPPSGRLRLESLCLIGEAPSEVNGPGLPLYSRYLFICVCAWLRQLNDSAFKGHCREAHFIAVIMSVMRRLLGEFPVSIHRPIQRRMGAVSRLEPMTLTAIRTAQGHSEPTIGFYRAHEWSRCSKFPQNELRR